MIAGPTPAELSAGPPLARAALRALALINGAIVFLASLALIAASLTLGHSVIVRTAFHAATYWQDEAAVFLLVGATFLSAAGVQQQRGHIGIEVLAGLLPPRLDAARMALVDALSALFCGFFAWKSWTLFYEAWDEGQVTASTWAPPLWIPYSLMASGMSLLTLQILVQLAAALAPARRA